MQVPCRVLKFPWPFRAGLAVSSDIDQTTPERFLEIHRFLNTREETPLGRGLGLDVADSFWLYSANPEGPPPISFFEGTSAREKDAALIREALAKGWVDTLHAYGDFSLAGGFRRELAQRALAALESAGLSVPVWANHGDDHNFQNLLAPGTYGDVPEKRSANGTASVPLEYHADLTLSAGVRFVWAGDLTRVLGQDRPASAWEHYRSHAEPGGRPAWLAWLCDRLARLSGGEAGPVGKALLRGVRYLGFPAWEGNDLAWPERLRDGRSVWRFRRFGDFRKDRAEDLDGILSEENLARLAQRGGAAVVFTHLGKSRRTDRILSPETVAAFERLARHQDSGRIWVARTSRLLRRMVAVRRARAVWEDGVLKLAFEPDPVLGSFGLDEDLAGLVVEVPGAPVRSVVFSGEALGEGRWRLRREAGRSFAELGPFAQSG